MKTLQIDIQVGFRSDSVEIAVDGDTVYRDADVTTSPLLDVAESFDVQLEEGRHRVDVRVTTRGLASSYSIDVEQDAYLGISVEGGNIVFWPSEEPFSYR